MAKEAGLPPEINSVNENNESIIPSDIKNELTDDEVEKGLKEIDFKDNVITIDTTDKRCSRIIRQQHSFAAKKTVAQGMMDVALITANANQLRYLVEYQRKSPTFWIIVALIIFSLLLQIAVGMSLIFKGRFDVKGKSKSPQAIKINNYVVVGVFLITIINVFVAAFSVTSAPSVLQNYP
ncbi:hypothetical protein HCN44_000947 [Aphidius gifuensis]|uniref:Ninjurin-1 n=1 Tax=Aphidius gifuensis TaxID=684658 RepID=A0A834XN96_APHGI|nr:ninjurin-B-like [Aphidius gifuensis]KAF7988374.1 hypothetical protein HCN44_000947 [Aphidius gifuensis]